MTLRTGRTNAEPRTAHAFTLVELMLVMALLTIVISVAAPSLGNFFRGRTLDAEARRLLALTRQGQSRAVSEGVPMILWFDTGERQYGLEEDPSYATENLENTSYNTGRGTDFDPKAVEFKIDKDLRLEIATPPPQTLLSSANMSSSRSRTPSASARNPANAALLNRHKGSQIRFMPDGTIDETSPTVVRLRDRNDKEIALQRAWNGMDYEIGNPTNQWNSLRR